MKEAWKLKHRNENEMEICMWAVLVCAHRCSVLLRACVHCPLLTHDFNGFNGWQWSREQTPNSRQQRS